MNKPRKVPALVVALLALLPLPACAASLSGKAIEGKVLEEGTHQPIPDALVVARWQGHLATFAHGKTVCYHVLSTTTDKQGTYRFPAWKKDITEDWQKNVRPETVLITAHKPGHQWSSVLSEKGDVQYLKPSTLSRGERLEYLERLYGSTGCGSGGDSERNAIPFLRKLYDESLSLTQTAEDQRQVESILYGIEKLELGFEPAQKRHLDRVKTNR